MVEPSAQFRENLCMLGVAIGRLSLEGLKGEGSDEFAICMTRKGLREGQWMYPGDLYLARFWSKLKPVGTGCVCVQCKIEAGQES